MLYNDKELAALLRKVKTIAVIGAVDKPGRPVDGVGRALIDMGFTVIPVHPARTGVWGLETYRTVADIPVPVDLVDVFRNAQFCPGHAEEVLALPTLPRCFWMQSGIFSTEARTPLEKAGVTVVEDRCLMVEARRLEVAR
ncbi:CoA-binding protein [Pseudodesulfovibrio sp.]|uniref:CoA-binding protein n=1 Tax=Pseudodesulfovibrio sp. TaxID=2035812 RepID=UPI002605154D|nr:CoA-binding protein [Pseudodesulfovibrio sp.]MDD3310682.1 CoA-binding protein [Pseudodesulfovibrio sp.]